MTADHAARATDGLGPADPPTRDHAARAVELLRNAERDGVALGIRVAAAQVRATLALADAIAGGRAVPRPRWDDDLTADPAAAADPTHRPGAVHVREAGVDGEPDWCRVHGLPWSDCSSTPGAGRG